MNHAIYDQAIVLSLLAGLLIFGGKAVGIPISGGSLRTAGLASLGGMLAGGLGLLFF